MKTTVEIIKHDKLDNGYHRIGGIIFTEDCMTSWVARTNEDYEIEQEDDLQIISHNGILLTDESDARENIKKTIQINRLKMVLGVNTNDLSQAN
jgi:hypothetical protein